MFSYVLYMKLITIVFFLFVSCFILSPNTSYAATNVTTCGQSLDVINETYTLNQSINSSGTCLDILNNSIVLDCNGFTINYSQSEKGNGINVTKQNHTIVKNCNIIQGNSSTNRSHAIYYKKNMNGTIGNNKIAVSGFLSFGISLNESVNNTLTQNNISVVAPSGFGIWLELSSILLETLDWHWSGESEKH